MKKTLTLMLVGLLLSVFAIGCGGGNDNNKNNDSANEATSITVTHQLGETEVPVNPENVVVFDMGVLDALDHLGVDVAGVPQSNVPEYLSKYTDETKYVNTGTLHEPDFEAVYGAEPELIIISARAQESYDELNEIAPTIFMGIDPTNFLESFKNNMETLGKIFGKEAEVEQEVAKVEEQIAKIKEKSAQADINGLILLANDGNISAYGPGSRFGFIHTEFGITPVDENIEASTHGQQVSWEYVAEKDPEYIFVVDRGAVVGGETTAQQMFENDLVKGTQAYQNDNIVYLDPVYWYISTGGLTSVNGMVDDILNAIE